MGRDGLLGRPRSGERLSSAEVAALDQPLASPPKPAAKQSVGAEKVNVKLSSLTWRWQVLCPRCGFKASGEGSPSPGQRLARCGGCKRTLYLA